MSLTTSNVRAPAVSRRRSLVASFFKPPGAPDHKIAMAKAGKGQAIMADEPVELDEHRGMAAQKSTEICRRLRLVQTDRRSCGAGK
jgi:hypothetical protein